MNGVGNAAAPKQHPSVRRLRLYDRPLLTAEAVGCYRDWNELSPNKGNGRNRELL